MTMRRLRYYFDQSKTWLIILTISILTLGLSLGLTSLQTSTKAEPVLEGRTVSISSDIACLGGNTNVTVFFDAQGDENAVSLNLNFNTQSITAVSTPAQGNNLPSGASFNANAGGGTVSIDISLPPGAVFPAG